MSAPALSVVVPAVNGWADLEACLSALEAEREAVDLEVLVADRRGDLAPQVAARFPWARVLPAPAGTPIPDLRALAFDHARAESVAVIEDHVLVPPGWARALLSARREARVVGGGVRNAATGRLVDVAAYLCEYSHLLAPLPAGEAEWLTGNNTVYDRAVLVEHRAATHAGRWEDYLHARLREAGIALVRRPEIVVDHKKHYTVREYVTQRYWYARSYAGARVAGAPAWRRGAYGLAALALPPVLLWRILARCRRGGVGRGLLLRCAPLLVLFVSAWGWGEVVGAWRGAGDALGKVC